MSDVKGFTVTLKKPVTDEVAEDIAGAIKMLYGVAAVTPHEVDAGDIMVEMRTRLAMQEDVLRALGIC